MSEVNWEYIISTIKSDKCVLILGPEVAVNHEGVPLHSALEKHLGVQDNDDILYFNTDEFLLFRDETAKLPTYMNIQNFYDATQPSEIYQKIAQIPFHLIISLSPDLLLKKVLEQHQIPHEFDYYRKYENPKKLEKPTKEAPLLYNLFGSVEDDESMIFTYDDMFEFLFAIAGNYQLPQELKNELKTAKNFILLGFKFEKWYVKLILRLFNLHSGKFLRYASKSIKEIEPDTKELYESHFRINFVENDLTDFTDKIFEICKVEGMLRELGTAKEVSLFKSIELLLDNGDYDTIFKKLKTVLENMDEEELSNDLTLLSSSYRRLMRRMNARTKTLTEEKIEIKLNQIGIALIEIAKEIDDLIEDNEL
jgi:hypothetical protein